MVGNDGYYAKDGHMMFYAIKVHNKIRTADTRNLPTECRAYNFVANI